MKKLIVHVGPHKTASTYVQSNLTHNAEMLRERGVCYPSAMRDIGGHHEVVTRLMQQKTGGFDALLKEVAPYETFVLSSENFTRLEPPHIESLQQLFGDREIHGLFYYRGMHELWPSHWQETIKQGGHENWPEYLIRAIGLTENVFARHLRPHVVLDRWTRTLGEDRFHIFPYSCIGADPLGALRPVCELASLDADDLKVHERGRNASYSAERVEAIRVLNRRVFLMGESAKTEIRRRYIKKSGEVESSNAFAALEGHFKTYARQSILRRADPYVRYMSEQLLDKHAAQLMRPLPALEREGERIVRYLDSARPVPDDIVADLAALL